MKIKKEHVILFFIFFLGVLIRIFLFLDIVTSGNDAPALMRLGKNLIENGRYAFGENYNWGLFFPPGYPLFIGIINLLLKDLFLSGKLISLFSSFITILLFYLIGKELHNKESGLFAAFAYAIHPSILITSGWVATEALFICLLFLSIYLFMVSIRKDNILLYVLLGISIGMSYLTRPEGLLLLLLPFLSTDGWNSFKSKKYLFKLSITLIIFITIASPYLLFIKHSTGRLSLSGKSSYLAALLESGVATEGIEYDKAAYLLDEGKIKLKAFNANKHDSISGFIIKKPFIFLRGYLRNSKEAISIIIKLSILILLPFFFSFFSKDLFKDKKKLVILLFSFLFFVVYPSFFILVRHMYPIALLLLLFSSIGFAQSTSAFSTLLDYYGFNRNKCALFLSRNIKPIIIIVSVLGSILGVFTSASLTSEKEIPTEYVKAAHFLKNNVSSDYEKLNIMQRMPGVSFYSDARFTMLPYAHCSDVINFAKYYNVDFIVIDERSSVSKWEFYNELINMDKFSNDVELIYEDNSGALIKLFKIKYK